MIYLFCGLLPIILFLGLKLFQWRSIYNPKMEIRNTPDDFGIPYEDLTLVTDDDGRISAWWIPTEQARGSVIVFHGNSGNVGTTLWALHLRQSGLNLLLIDYRGFGKSQGFPSEKKLYADARAGYEWLRTHIYRNAPHPPIAAYGRSLGCAVALHLAVERSLRGLIMESGFSSTHAMGLFRYPRHPLLHWVTQSHFNNLSRMPKLNVPVMITHARDDETVPWFMAEQLFETANEPKRFIEINCSHNESPMESSPGYAADIAAFLDTLNWSPTPNPREVPPT